MAPHRAHAAARPRVLWLSVLHRQVSFLFFPSLYPSLTHALFVVLSLFLFYVVVLLRADTVGVVADGHRDGVGDGDTDGAARRTWHHPLQHAHR